MAFPVDNIRNVCRDKHTTLAEIERALGISNGTIARWQNGATYPKHDKLKAIADYLEVPLNVITGEADDMPAPTVAEDAVAFPVIGGVAAGYDHIAYEDWTGDNIEIPRSYLHGRPATDYFVLRVSGDSMFPEFQDGDHVLVLKQATMDRSGQIGVVIYADENSTLKRIEYAPGEDWMTLRPVNPQFKPVTIRGAELERCTVLGVAKMIIREVQ